MWMFMNVIERLIVRFRSLELSIHYHSKSESVRGQN